MGDEHTVIPVFFSGVLLQALLVSRSMLGAAGAATIAGLSLGTAWYLTRNEPDQIWSLPFMAVGLFVVVFACFYREHLLPRISASLLLHYTLLGVYALYGFADEQPVPGWVLGVLAIPASLAVYVGVATRPAGRFLKLTSYVWFLILLTVLIGQQLSLDGLKEIYDAEGFSLSLNAYIFVSGMVFLLFASNVLFLLLLIPMSNRNILWDSLLGSADAATREHRDVLVSKMSSQRISWVGLGLLVAHAAGLVANYHFELIPPGVWMNAAVVGVAMLSTAFGVDVDDEPSSSMLISEETAHRA